MKIIIGENVYNGNRGYIDSCLNIAKDKYTREKVNAIYALEKDDMYHMMRQTYSTNMCLKDAVKEYEEIGFKCHYVEHLKKGES